MFLKNILVFVKSLFSAQTIEPEIIGFSGVTLETVGNFFTLAGTIICEIIYGLVKWLLAIVDFLQYFIQKLIGLDYWLKPGSKTIEGATDNDLLFKFLYNDTVQNVFRAMVGVFIILTIVFVIFAIVKTEWKYATGDGKGGNSKMQIFRSSFKSFILVLVFPLVLTLGIISSNAILASLVGALNLNMAQTFGGTLFSIAAESANKYRIYSSNDDKAPVSQQVTFYVDNSTGKTILFSNGSQYPADKYCEYIADYGDYLEYIYGKTGSGGDRCSKYTVDSIFDILVPRQEKNFSGYCVGLQVDGKTKFFLVKCDYGNKDGYYYYLRNLLNGKVVSKNQTINSSQGLTGSTVDSLRSDLKDYMEDTGKQSFMSGVNLHDFGSGEVVDAAYNTWGYASVYTQKHTFEAAQSFGMVYQDTLSKFGLTSVSSAKVSFNSNAVSPYFDNGQFGYVSKQAEYKVMADIVDFICNNNADLYMIDVTSSMVKWDHGDYVPESRFVGGTGANHRVNHSAGATTPGNTNSALADDVLPFIVSYSDLCNDADMGNQLYIAHANKTSEVEGAVYVMCWKIIEGGKTRYVPLVNGKGYYDEATGVEFPTFKSEFYSNGYRGLVVAKGLLNNETTNQAYGEPTYIASGVKNLNGVEGLEAPYYYELAVNSELYQYAKGITATPSANVSSDGRYEVTDIIASGISASLSPDTYDDGSKYYELISRGDNPTALATDPTIIANMTIYLKNREDNTVRTAKYAGLTMNFADTTHADALNNNGKYLFVTSDGGYFVVSATKATDFASGYFIHAITGYNTGLATVGDRENAYFNLMYLKTDLKAFYYKDSSHKGEKEIAGDIALNMFEPTNAKYDGKAVFKTIDMHYLDLATELNFTKTMYLNVAFNTSNQSFFSYSETDANKFKVALPVQIDGTSRPTAAQQKQMQSTIFFDVNYYDFLTGYVNGNLKRYDITKESNPVSTGTINPVLTETYAVNSTGFVWDASAVSYDLYDGDRYVATIYKPANVACGTISDLITVSSHMMIEYTSYYNIRTQNNYTSESAFEEHGLNLRNSFVVGFNRDSLKSRSFIFDFRISLLGKGRLKLIMSSYEVEKDVQKGFLYTSDSLAFDYFFDGEGTVSGNKIELRTFYVPTKVANPFGVGFWIMCISAALIIKILGTALWGIIKRFYEITLYYIAMPAVASTIVLDDGKRFQQSIQTPLISKVLSTYGVILGINAFFVLLAPVKSMSNVFTAADIATSGSYFLKALSNLPLFGSYELTAKLLNAYTYILFLLVAFTMINELPGLITRIMGTGKDGGDVLASGKQTKDAVKKTMVEAGKTMSGQSLLEGAQGIGQTAMGMIPGSALAQAGAQTIGGLMKGKGGGGGGGQKREGEEDDGAANQDAEFNQGQIASEPGGGGGNDGDGTAVEGTVDNAETETESEDGAGGPGQEREDMELEGEGNPAEQAGAEVAEQVEEQAGEIMEHTMDNGVTDLTDTPVGEAMEEAGEKMAEEAGQQVGEEGKKAGEEQAEEGKKAGEQAAEEGKKAGEQAAEEGKKAGEQAGEDGKKKGIVEEAKDISAKQQAHIKHFFGAIGGGIKTGLTATGQFFKKAGGVVASPFVKAGRGIAKGVSTAAKWVGNKASFVGGKIGDTFIRAKEKVQNVAGKIYEKGLKPIGQKAKSIAQKVGSGVSYVAGAVKNKAMDGAAWVRNKAVDIKDAVKTKALAAKDWVGDKALRAKNWVGDKAGWVKDKFVAAGGWVKGKATAVGGWVGKKYDKAKEKVLGAASVVYGKVLQPIGQKARTIAKYGLATAMTIAAPFKAAGKGIAKAAKATYGAVLRPIGKGAKKVAEKAAVGASYLGKAAKSGAGWVKKHSGTIKKVAKVAGIAGMAALTVANPAAALTVGAGFVAAKAVKKAAVSVYGNVLKPIGQGAKNIVQKAASGVSYVAHGVKSGVASAKQFATEHQVGKKAGKFARGALAAGLIGFGLTSPAGLLGVAAGVTVARGVRRTGKDIAGLTQKAYGGIMSRKNKGQGGAAVTEKIEAQGSYVTSSGSKVTVSNAGGTGAKQVLGTPAAGTTPSGNSEQRLQDSRERNDAHTKWMQAQSGKRWAQGQLNDRQKELTTLEGMKINKSEADMTEADRAHNASVDQRIASKKQEVDAAKMKLNEKMAAEDTAKQNYQTLDKQFKANYGAESNAVQGVVVTGAPSGDNLADNSKTVGASGLTTTDRTARIGANTEQIALNNELIKTAETSIAEEGAAVFASSDKIGQLVQNGTLSAGQVNTQQWGAGKKVYSVADAVGEDGVSLAEKHGVMSSSQVSKSIQNVAQSKADIDSFKAENTAKQAEIDTLVAEEKQVTGAQVVAKTESKGRTVQAKAMTTANTVAEKIVEKAEKAESYVAKGATVTEQVTKQVESKVVQGATPAEVVKSPAVEKIEKAIETGTSFVTPGKDQVVPVGTAADVVGGKDVPVMSEAESAARDSLGVADAAHSKAKQERIAAEDNVYRKNAEKKATQHQIDTNNKKKENLIKQLDYDGSANESDSDRVQREAKNRQIEEQITQIDADNVQLEEKKKTQGATKEDKDAVLKAREKESSLKKQKTTAKKEIETVMSTERKEARKAEKETEQSKAVETARGSYDKANKEYYSARVDRIHAEDAITAKEKIQKDADKKIASNAKKREDLQEQFNNAESGGDKDRIAAQMRALDADDKEQQKRKSDAQVTDADRQALEDARKKEDGLKAEKSKAKKTLADTRRGTDTSFVNEGKDKVVPAGSGEKIKEAKKKPGKEVSEEETAARTKFDEKTKLYNEAKGERKAQEKAIAAKESVSKDADKKMAANAKKRAKLEEQFNNAESGGDKDRIAAEMRALDADDKEQQKRKADAQVTDADRKALETAKTKESNAKTAKTEAKAELIDVMAAEIRVKQFGPETPFVPAKEETKKVAAETFKGELNAAGKTKGFVPEGKESDASNSTTATEARKNAKGDSTYLTIDANGPSERTAKNRYNLDKINDPAVVADKDAALANIVRNQSDTEVGLAVSLRSIARYGGRGTQNRSLGAQVYAGINGGETQEGLLTAGMKEQLIVSTFTKPKAELYGSMSNEDRQKVLESYQVVGGLRNGGGLHGSFGFEVRGKDGNQYANNDVTALVLGQMMASDKITKENINKSAGELGLTKNLEAQLAKNLALGVDYTSDLSKTENLTDSKVYRTATTSKKHSDVVAQGILDHITADPESDLFKAASKDLGISSPKDLENPAVKERVIDQISRMKNSDGKNSINTIPEADYSGKIANVMKDSARSGDFKVTPWDYASAETKANEIANVEAMKDGTIREDLAAAEKRLSRQAVKDDEQKVLLNTFATTKVDDKSTIVNGMISSGKFVNTTAEDGKRLQGVVAGIADDDTSEKAQLVKSAGDDQLMLAMKKGIMLKDIGSDRAGLNVDILAKYLKGGDDIDTALIQNIARRGMNNGSVKSAVGVLESSLTSDQRSSMLDAAANQGTLGLTVGENRNLKRMLKDTDVDVNKLSYFEAKSVLAGATTDQIAVEVEHEAKVDKATNKLVESQGNLITNDAVKAELEKGGENKATATMFASNYSDKISMLNDSEKEGIKLSAAKVEIDKFNAENVDGKVELAENASLADVAKAVKGNAGLSAKIDVAGLDAIDAENKQRLAMGMGERIKMYAADIQGDQSLYNKARSAFRTGNPGKDLDEADSMVRNNYLANEFVNSLSANDKNLVNARRGEIDLDYISKMTGMSREEAKALQKEAKSSGKSIDSMMIEKGKVKTVDADKVDTEIIKKMETGEFVELHNEAKRENYNEEVHGVNKVKYNILRNSPNATPAVDVDAMDYEQKSRYEFTRNLFQQMNRTGENPNMLANTFRNTNLYDNDRVVEEMASIQIKGQDAINPKLSVEEKKKRLSNEQINAYLGSHEEYKDILTSYAAADVTRTLDDKTKEKNLSKIAKENPELSAKVNAEIKAQGKQPHQTSAEDYNKILQDLMKKDEAFKNAMYSKLTDAFDPGAKLSHEERIMFFENNKVIEKESTGNTMKSINEWLSKYIATDGKDTGNILLNKKQNLPENSAVYNNWNKYLDSKIGEIQSRQGQYADMTGDQRKAEIQKLQTKYIKPTNVDNLSDEELEAHVKQQEKNKQDAFAVGDFTAIYSKGAKVNKIDSKNVRAVIAKNGFESNGEFDVLTGKRITNEVEERHKSELAAATNNETRYKAASKMRTSSDFGENFNAMAVSYLGQKSAQDVNNEATRRFLMSNKGKATKTGILDENFKYNDLTPDQQKDLQKERRIALERQLGNNVAHASMKVNNDRLKKESESWMQSKGLMAEIVRYTNGTTKFTKQQSKTTETGVIPPKSAAKIRANQTEYLSTSADRQSVEEFNRSYRGTKTQYADAVRSKVSGESSKKALEELLNSKDISGKKFTDNALSVQKAEIERLLNNLTNKAENRLNTSYKYIPSPARPYIGSTFSLAVNRTERELQISKLADYRSSLDTISKSRGKVSYDSVFSNLNSSVRNQFNNSMSSKARTEFNNKSDDAKFAQLEQYLLKNYNKLSNHVKVNNFYHANTSALTNMNGVSVKRSVSSAENKDIMKALKPGEAIRYNDILHRRETEVVKYNKEEQHYNKLTEKLSTTKDVKEQKVIRQQMSDSATKLTTYQRTIQEIDKEKRVFEQKIEARRSSDDVRVSGGLGYNKSRNVLDDYAFRTKGVNGQPGKPVHKGGPLDRPMNLAILRFMERYKNQVQQIVKTEIYNQNAVLKQYTRGKVNKLTNDLSRTIADNRQLRKFFTAELQRLENSMDAKDMAIKNALSNDIDRLTTAEQALKTDLQGLGIELSSMEKRVDLASKNATKPITKK